MDIDFSDISIFSDLNESELKDVENKFTSRSYPKNSMIILEEEFGDIVFIIIEWVFQRLLKRFSIDSFYYFHSYFSKLSLL